MTVLYVARCPVPTATGIVLARNWLAEEFAEDGLRFEAARGRDAQFREGGNVPILAERARGDDRSVLVGLTWVDEKQYLLARPGSDIARLADLRGLRFGLSTSLIWRAMALRGFATTLGLAGLTTDDVTLVDLDGDEGGTWSAASERALLAGEVDVIYAKGAPAETLRLTHGLDVVFDVNAHPDARKRINNGTPRPVTVERALLDRRPEIVARYLALLLRAADWAGRNAGEVRRIVAAETGSDPDSVDVAYGPNLFPNLRLRLTPSWIDALQSQADFLRDRGLIDDSVAVERWLDPAPLAEAERIVTTATTRVARAA